MVNAMEKAEAAAVVPISEAVMMSRASPTVRLEKIQSPTRDAARANPEGRTAEFDSSGEDSKADIEATD